MLRAQTKFGGVGAGNDLEVVLLTDIGPDACKVGGYPGLVGVTSSGKHVPLVARHGTYFVDPTPGEITPGSSAELNLGSYGPACQDHTLPDYTSLIVELPARMGEVTVSQFNMANAAQGTFMPCELSESQIGVSATSTATPAAAAPCTNEQLSWRASPTHPGDTNDVGALVVITNKSPKVCSLASLAGTPDATATLSTGATTAVSSGQRIAALPPTVGQPVDLSPGSTADLLFGDPPDCASGPNQSPPAYRALHIRFDEQTVTITLSGLTVPASCGFPLSESPFYDD